MEVETKNATLDTMAVTIRALHVGGKQMTLSVFRQLPVADAYKEDGSLADNLEHWGIVRYDIKDQGGLWLVASRDGILWRCTIDVRRYSAKDAAQNLSRRREETLNYLAWEPLEAAHLDFYAKSKVGPAPWVPRALKEFARERAWKVGNAAYFRKILADAEMDVTRATNLEQTVPKLLALPQLFIAV